MRTQTKNPTPGAISLLLTGFLLAGAAACSSGPEGAIADHIKEVADIMKDNTESPKEGLEEIREYMQDNLPAVMEQVGVALVELDKCESNEDRRERLEEMQEELAPAIQELQAAAGPFMEAVMTSEEARQYLSEVQGSMEGMEDILEGLGID
jgi:hypothetical protein